MLDDDVRIRPATIEDLDELADIAWCAKEYWDYDVNEMNNFREIIKISPKMIENNQTFLLENVETEEIYGFYCLEKLPDGKCWLKHICVAPEYMGTGLGGDLFLNACEISETMGIEELWILSDSNSEKFFVHMGAEKIGTQEFIIGNVPTKLPVLRIKLI
jgi:N-acetylglutamate synthase-like GNAT family acetyltransferase